MIEDKKRERFNSKLHRLRRFPKELRVIADEYGYFQYVKDKINEGVFDEGYWNSVGNVSNFVEMYHEHTNWQNVDTFLGEEQ